MDKPTGKKPSTPLEHLRAAEAALRGRHADLRRDERALLQGLEVLFAALGDPDGETARGMAALRGKIARQEARQGTATAEELLAHMADRFDGVPRPVDWREFADEVYEFYGSRAHAYVTRVAFLAHVARRLPNKPLQALATAQLRTVDAVIDALDLEADTYGEPSDADWAESATYELKRAIGPVWEAAALTSNTIREADVPWFLRRALEAMGLDANKVTTKWRMQTVRERKKAKAAKKK